jgi:hypothetical protein
MKFSDMDDLSEPRKGLGVILDSPVFICILQGPTISDIAIYFGHCARRSSPVDQSEIVRDLLSIPQKLSNKT